MLLELALWLGKDARFFNVFGYITLRTMLADPGMRGRNQASRPMAGSQAQMRYTASMPR